MMAQEKIKPYEGIDIWHMICHVAKSWWKMLIAMAVFAVLLGGLSYYRNAKGLKAAAEAKEAADEKKEESLSRILTVDEEKILEQSGLSQKAADEVLYYANKYYYNKKQYERQNNYLKESILMQMDPNNVWTTTLYYDLSVSGSAGEERPSDAAFAASYIAKISNEAVYDEIAKELGADIDSGYFAEVITGSCLDRLSDVEDVTVISTDSEDMKIVIRYTDRAGCEKIAGIIKEKISASNGAVTGEVGPHTIALVGEQTEQRSDGELLNQQRNQISALGNLSDNVINARTNIETSEEGVFNQLIEYYEARDAEKITAIKSIEAEEEEGNVPASSEDVSEGAAADGENAVKPKVSKKYVALGLFLGIFVIGAWEACRYFFSRTLKQDKDLEEGYGLSTYDKEDKAVISMVLQNKCKKNGWNKLYAVSSLGRDVLEEAVNGLKPEGVKLVESKESPLKDEDELKILLEADGVILSEKLNASSHKEIARLLELCRELEKPVICALVAGK